MFGPRYFGSRYFPPRYFGVGLAAVAGGYFGHRYFAAQYYGPRYFSPAASGTTPTTTATNSGVQRLRAFHDGQDQDGYYREVQRRQALQVQQIRLAELQQQQQEIEAKRIADEALRKAGETQRGKAKKAGTLLPNPALGERIVSLTSELAALNSAIIDTRVEIARLDAIEAYEALLAEQAMEDETILILAASI